MSNCNLSCSEHLDCELYHASNVLDNYYHENTNMEKELKGENNNCNLLLDNAPKLLD